MQKQVKKKSSLSVVAIPFMSLLMAIEIILTRFLSINLPMIRIGFGFIPMAMLGIMYGPLWAGGVLALGDFIGAMLFPTGTGVFFPGFTLSAFLTGVTWGIFLHNKPVTWATVVPASLIVCFGINMCLDSVWVYMLLKDGMWAYLPVRILKAFIYVPMHIILIPLVWNKVLVKVLPQKLMRSPLPKEDKPI